MNPDLMRYLVISGDSAGDYLPERRLCDLDRATTVADIATGQFGEVLHVIEFNIAEGIICDRTEDVLSEAEGLRAAQPRHTGQDQIDWLRDRARKLRNES
jgi:hypothetical protein